MAAMMWRAAKGEGVGSSWSRCRCPTPDILSRGSEFGSRRQVTA